MAGIVASGQSIRAFLHYCRTEKGLAANSLEAYRRDLTRLTGWLANCPVESVTLDTLRSYLDYLREKRLSNRSIARQVAAMRSCFGFLHE
jgi:site-specific recombinase XerD